MRWYSSGIHTELLGAGWEVALVAVLLTWRWEDLGSTRSVDLLDFSFLFFDFGFYRGIDFLRGMVEVASRLAERPKSRQRQSADEDLS